MATKRLKKADLEFKLESLKDHVSWLERDGQDRLAAKDLEIAELKAALKAADRTIVIDGVKRVSIPLEHRLFEEYRDAFEGLCCDNVEGFGTGYSLTIRRDEVYRHGELPPEYDHYLVTWDCDRDDGTYNVKAYGLVKI